MDLTLIGSRWAAALGRTPTAPLLAAVLLAGCGGTPAATDNAGSSAWAEQLREIAIRPSPALPTATRDLLIRAADAGEMTFEIYDEGMHAWEQCMADAGLKPGLLGPVQGEDGLLQYRTSYQFPVGVEVGDPEDLALSAIADACDATFAAPISIAYITQPVAQQTRELRFLEYRDALLNCVKSNGGVVDAGSTESEIFAEINEIAASRSVDCGLTTGYSLP